MQDASPASRAGLVELSSLVSLMVRESSKVQDIQVGINILGMFRSQREKRYKVFPQSKG